MFHHSIRPVPRWAPVVLAVCLWGLLCLGALTPDASAGPPVDALLNGGFEEADLDGRPRHWLATTGTATQSITNVRSGARSAAFSHSQAGGGSLVQAVPVEGQAQYRLEGHCALSGPAHSVQLFITWAGISVTSPNAGPTPGLQFMETGRVSPPPGAATAMVGMRFRTDGTEATVHCDDLALLRTDPSPTVSPFTPTMTPSATQPPPTVTATPSPHRHARPGCADRNDDTDTHGHHFPVTHRHLDTTPQCLAERKPRGRRRRAAAPRLDGLGRPDRNGRWPAGFRWPIPPLHHHRHVTGGVRADARNRPHQNIPIQHSLSRAGTGYGRRTRSRPYVRIH